MDPRIAAIGLTSGLLPVLVDVAAVATLLVCLVRLRTRRSLLVLVAAALLGAGVGLFLCWLLSDQLDLFGVSLSPVSRAWVAGAFAAVAIAVASIPAPRRWRRVIAIVAIPVCLIAGALGVNADFGQYPTLGSLKGNAVAPPIKESVLAMQRAGAPGSGHRDPNAAPARLWERRVPAASMAHGIIGTVEIPGRVSHFPARRAYLYLPPAALVPHPVALPVVILLSGQPGGPNVMAQSGSVAAAFDAFEMRHRGIAPIVVIPDQLTAPQLNPMCVDSALGKAATYLTVDVPRWIRTHLTVQTGSRSWAIGGFSEGGTCTIQLGSAHPDLFGALIDISGEQAPTNGSRQQTIERGFGGSNAAYVAALPVTLLSKNAPFRDSVALFASGQFDATYGPIEDAMAVSARDAGMHVSRAVSPGTAHDWHTVQWVLATQLDPIYRQLGLLRPTS